MHSFIHILIECVCFFSGVFPDIDIEFIDTIIKVDHGFSFVHAWVSNLFLIEPFHFRNTKAPLCA